MFRVIIIRVYTSFASLSFVHTLIIFLHPIYAPYITVQQPMKNIMSIILLMIPSTISNELNLNRSCLNSNRVNELYLFFSLP